MRPLPGAPALVGTVVGARYRVIQLLGSGGTGDVYLAEGLSSVASWAGAGAGPVRPPARGRVAIKVLRVEHRADRALVRRFRREAEAAEVVRHPNVLEVLEPPFEGFPEGVASGDPPVLCFVMELLVGLDLADTLAYSRTLGAPRAVGIAAGAADGLAAAHAAGVVHRDVKPENIFLVHAADGREAVKLLDFGFAWIPGDEAAPTRRTAARSGPPTQGRRPRPSALGTPEYMAPEQAQGAPAAPSADIYSLGVVLYEMLAGRAPFDGAYPAIAREHAERPVPPIGSFNPAVTLSPELTAVVACALAKDPAARFPSMSAFRRALLATPEASARTL
jgi:eukaryotic-like serine/threonine-protein kinase